MPEELDLFDMTFDQQLNATDNDIEQCNILPNRRISGEVILEPVRNGVRVTARDDQHRVLWGFIGSKDMLGQVHCPVAVYETLQVILGKELKKNNLPTKETANPMQAAQQALDALRETLDSLQSSVKVKKVSDATYERAKVIARIVNDANRMISLEADSLKGAKGTAE